MKKTRDLAIAAMILAVVGCSTPTSEQVPDETQTSVTPAAADIVALYEQATAAFSAGDISKDFFTEDAVLNTSQPPAEGSDAVVAAMQAWRAPSSDLKVKSETIYVLSEGLIAVEGISNGTNDGAFGEVPASNNPMGLNWFQLVWYDGDKVKRIDSISNTMTMLQQIGGAPSPSGTPPAVPAMPAETQVLKGAANADNEATMRAYLDAFNKGDTDTQFTLLDPGYTFAHHGMNATMDLEQVKGFYAQLGTGLSNMNVAVNEMWSVGDFVISKATFSAKHTGEVMGMAATNNDVSINLVFVTKVAGGKLVSNTEYVDMMTVVPQLQAAK